MSKNKSFFQKLSESFINLFPFNSTSKHLSNDSFDTNLSQNKLISNRRVASEAFGKINDNEFKIKRAKLSHDPMSFPTSRIIKPQNQNNEKFINFNDGASDYSESSSISVSTSGVSSLHPRTNKRIHFGDGGEIPTNMKYSRNLNLSFNQNEDLISPFSSIKSVKNNTLNNFMSSPAKKILEKLDKLTTPITACDRLTNLLAPDPLLSIKRPCSRPFQGPPKYSKKPCPMKAVTVSISSPITNDNYSSVPQKPVWSKKKRSLGYFDTDIDNDIDLNSETITGFTNSSTQINLLNKKSQSTDTDDFCFQHINGAELSPVLKFTFRPPNSFEDEFYGSTTNNEKIVSSSVYKFKSIITDEEIKQYDRRFICQDSTYKNKAALLWRCDTCFMENVDDILECTNCGNLSKKNKDKVIISQSAIKSALSDEKLDIVKKVLENDKHSTMVDNKVMGTVPVLALNSQTLAERSNSASDENSNFINVSNAESGPTISSVVSRNMKAVESNNKIDFSTNSNAVNSQGKINCEINENIVNQTSESKAVFTFGKSSQISSDSKTEPTITESKTDCQFPKLFKFGECSNSDSSAISTPLSINTTSNVISTPFSFKPVFKEQSGNVENDTASSKAPTVSATKEVLSINSSCPFNLFSASNATIKLTESQKILNTTIETPFSFGCSQNNTLPPTVMNFGLSSSVITSPLATSIPSFGTGLSSVMSPLTSFNSISTANSSASCFQFGGSENIASNFGSNVGLSSGFNFPINSTRFQFGQSSNADGNGNINPSGAGVPFQFNSGGGNVGNSNEIGAGIAGNHGIAGCNTPRRLLKPRRKR